MFCFVGLGALVSFFSKFLKNNGFCTSFCYDGALFVCLSYFV